MGNRLSKFLVFGYVVATTGTNFRGGIKNRESVESGNVRSLLETGSRPQPVTRLALLRNNKLSGKAVAAAIKATKDKNKKDGKPGITMDQLLNAVGLKDQYNSTKLKAEGTKGKKTRIFIGNTGPRPLVFEISEDNSAITIMVREQFKTGQYKSFSDVQKAADFIEDTWEGDAPYREGEHDSKQDIVKK